MTTLAGRLICRGKIVVAKRNVRTGNGDELLVGERAVVTGVRAVPGSREASVIDVEWGLLEGQDHKPNRGQACDVRADAFEVIVEPLALTLERRAKHGLV